MKNILIVDDDSMNCVLAKHALVQSFQVATAHSGKEALEHLEKELPDLILMDIEMPGMDGKEVVRRIKMKQEWMRIPIVFLTADSDPMTEAECLQCGADDFITKPFVPLVMRSRVEKILEAQEVRKELEQQLEKNTLKSLTDALTGLHNREYLENTLQELLAKGHTGTLFMIDLDNFKTMNDTYGHIVGDKVLQHFAEVLRSVARKEDIVCRLAGDEFVTFYTDLTDKSAAAEKAESIIRLFAEKMGALGYAGIVSVSIGAKITSGNEEFQKLYSKADTSLYFVKNNGKNAYHFYGEHAEKLNEIDTVADLEYIRKMMEEGLQGGKGAFHVAYDEFKKIYDFVQRCVARKNQKVQVVLFTLKLPEQNTAEMSMDRGMDILTYSVVSSLRSVDTGTKYSSSQYIVILMDTDLENGKVVAQRVMKRFRENGEVAASNIEISFDIQTMEQI